MNSVNTKTVFVVYNDKRKNMKDAERFGELKDVFSSIGRNYNGDKLIEHARRVLQDWKEGDYLLLVGDPALCAICTAVALEYDAFGEVNILRWNRDDFQYVPLTLNFNYGDETES